MQREVAIKTLHFSRHDPQQNQQLLSEARTASQLRHPNIVPIFEAGEASGDPYLVFEYVPGQNLSELLKREGRLSPARALAILSGVLDAIGHAHEAGIVHRDLKPSNILIDDKGAARIMDFGIAARVDAQSGGADVLMGTLCYMAPEYIAERISSERSDIFSAGLVLYEMLVGAPAVAGANRETIINRLAAEDIRLPVIAGLEIDVALASLLYRALARDPDQRIPSVRQFREMLDDYMKPFEPAPSADATQSTIDFLLRRMRVKSDFPALSDSVSTINKITRSDKESIAALSTSILKDFSLTNKILRLVNSVYYRQAGGGQHQHDLACGIGAWFRRRSQYGGDGDAVRAYARQGGNRESQGRVPAGDSRGDRGQGHQREERAARSRANLHLCIVPWLGATALSLSFRRRKSGDPALGRAEVGERRSGRAPSAWCFVRGSRHGDRQILGVPATDRQRHAQLAGGEGPQGNKQ